MTSKIQIKTPRPAQVDMLSYMDTTDFSKDIEPEQINSMSLHLSATYLRKLYQDLDDGKTGRVQEVENWFVRLFQKSGCDDITVEDLRLVIKEGWMSRPFRW